MNRKIRKVIDMCITEYNEEETLQEIGNEKFAEGRAVGKEEGRAHRKLWYRSSNLLW